MFLSWDPLDQDKVLAYLAAEASVCKMCGSREEDWKDEDGKPLDVPPLTPVGISCRGCAETARYEKSVYSDGRPPGVTIRLYPEKHVNPEGRIVPNWRKQAPKPSGG